MTRPGCFEGGDGGMVAHCFGGVCPCERQMPALSIVEMHRGDTGTGQVAEPDHPRKAIAALRMTMWIRRHQIVHAASHRSEAAAIAPGIATRTGRDAIAARSRGAPAVNSNRDGDRRAIEPGPSPSFGSGTEAPKRFD